VKKRIDKEIFNSKDIIEGDKMVVNKKALEIEKQKALKNKQNLNADNQLGILECYPDLYNKSQLIFEAISLIIERSNNVSEKLSLDISAFLSHYSFLFASEIRANIELYNKNCLDVKKRIDIRLFSVLFTESTTDTIEDFDTKLKKNKTLSPSDAKKLKELFEIIQKQYTQFYEVIINRINYYNTIRS
jgi:hypothetical protein